jgi:DNA-binding GntR family transcriptional regulator
VIDPMYRQIAEDLRRQIEAGELAPGAQLLTEPELREKYKASRNTIRDAIKWLITRGLVDTRPGQGTFVLDTIDPFVTTLSGDAQTGFGGGEDAVYRGNTKIDARDQESRVPRVEIQIADDAVAQELKLPEGASVVSRHQQRLIDSTPWALQTSFYPIHLVEQGATRLIQAADIRLGTVKYLADTLGVEQAGWRDTISVRAPDESETAFFRLPEDGRISIVETRRTAFDTEGTPLRLTVTAYPADHNKFAINVGQVPHEVKGTDRPGTGRR